MAKTKKPRPPRQRKPKQTYIPGTEPPCFPEIDGAAENYYEAMQERVKLSKEEDEAKDNLIDKMKAHGLTRCEYDDKVVSITDKSNVKVKRKKTVESNGDTSEE